VSYCLAYQSPGYSAFSWFKFWETRKVLTVWYHHICALSYFCFKICEGGWFFVGALTRWFGEGQACLIAPWEQCKG